MVTKVLLINNLLRQTVILFFLVSCVPLGTVNTSQSSKKIVYEDQNYEEYVGNVILNSNNPFQELGSSQPLNLEFDLLTNKLENLQVRYIHCNADWKPSRLQESLYLRSFNQFNHKNFDYSGNTRTPYIQYFFELDRPFLSGNYLIAVYRRANSEDILFTRRMVFYENRVNINGRIRVPATVKNRRTHQQIDFDITYNRLEAPIPMENFKPVLLQNKNWNHAITNLKASSVKPGEKKLEWNLFTGQNTFPGWNQFRFLDLRTLNLRGINIAKIETIDTVTNVYQGLDKSFGNGSYRGLINDNNGRFIPGNSDPGESWLEADYANVHLSVKSERLNGKVYITGRFNDWRMDDHNIMQYDQETQTYQGRIRLKQGFYDYMYYVESKEHPSYALEGSHFQAENEYDILIYYRAPGQINDEVVGFYSMNSLDYF